MSQELEANESVKKDDDKSWADISGVRILDFDSFVYYLDGIKTKHLFGRSITSASICYRMITFKYIICNGVN